MASIAIPAASIIGGAISKANAIFAGILMTLSVIGMALVFGFNGFTAIPLILTAIAALLAFLAAGSGHTG